MNNPGSGFVESVFTFADQRRDGGVVERLLDFVAEVFLPEEPEEEDRFDEVFA